jgi:hypothetical protein
VVQTGQGQIQSAAPALRAGDVLPTLAASGLLVLAVPRLAGAVGDAASLAALALAAWLGLCSADLASGVVHWLCDRFGDERTPVVGRLVIAPFREHHADPQILARKDFFAASSSNAWLTLVVLLPWWALRRAPQGAGACLVDGFVVSLCAFVFLTNTFHQWAHQAEPPRAARWLQRLRISITPELHARHHASGDRAYCVTTGWCNAALDRWRVFERVERAALRCLPRLPHRSRGHG